MSNLEQLTLVGIAHRCAQESKLYSKRESHDPRYCFELFRRAIMDRNQRAWELIYDQYHTQTAGWVVRHQHFQDSYQDAQYFVQLALARMWTYLTPEKFAGYKSLAALLNLLKMCVGSAIIDFLRSEDSAILFADMGDTPIELPDASPNTETQVLESIQIETLWEELNARLNDDKERIVMEATFATGLKPREILEEYSGAFQDIGEIYRIKENVLARLKRDSEFRDFLQPDA